MEPVLPGKAEALWNQLGESGSVHDAELGEALAAPPAEFGEPEELFEGFEDERVEELNEQLQESIEAAEDETESDEADDDEDAAMELEPVTDERVSFEEFKDLDIRVAEILDVEPIEGADDLVKLEVDIGVETRQIVAGIKQLHDLDELPGTKIVVLANLEQAELFGVESNGMLLAAGEEADLLTTLEDAEPGTKVQ
jgi:methionyl-tRNA synthetase